MTYDIFLRQFGKFLMSKLMSSREFRIALIKLFDKNKSQYIYIGKRRGTTKTVFNEIFHLDI